MTLVECLNRSLSLEITAVLQYSQHSYLVTGTDREVFGKMFQAHAEEAQGHANFLGNKIVALGGVPTVETGMVQQSTSLEEMLMQNLELEREAYQSYVDAWEACGKEELATKFWLEEQIAEEKLHIEELEKLTGTVNAANDDEKIVLSEAG